MDSTMAAGIIGAAAGVCGGWVGASATRWSTRRAERVSATAALIGEMQRALQLPPGEPDDLLVRHAALRLVDPHLAARAVDAMSAARGRTGELTASVWDDPRLHVEAFTVLATNRLNAHWWTRPVNRVRRWNERRLIARDARRFERLSKQPSTGEMGK